MIHDKGNTWVDASMIKLRRGGVEHHKDTLILKIKVC